jgi:hypothetical protein
VTPRQLLRLYPRQWRKRYGDEFLAVVESSPIDRPVIRDVLRAAAGEWIFETLTGRALIALVITSVASVLAQYLQSTVPVQPLIEVLGDGGRAVSPPWPTALGVWASGLQLVFIARSILGFFPWSRIHRWELLGWIALFFAASIGSQWGSFVAWYGTGIAPDSVLKVWSFHALMTYTALSTNYIATIFNPRFVPPKPQRSLGPPARPLGLTR